MAMTHATPKQDDIHQKAVGDVVRFDFTADAFMAAPFEGADVLRENGPLVRVKLPIIGKVWVATTQEALAGVLKDDENFSVRRGDGSVAGTKWWMPRTIMRLTNNMLSHDDPDHRRLRTLVDGAFKRDRITALEPRIQVIANGLAKDLFDGSAQPDLIRSFARPLPLAVICELLGIRESDRSFFTAWAEGFTRVNGIVSFLRALWPIRKLNGYLETEIARQRKTPGDGLIAELIAMQDAGEPISDDELIAMVFLLLVAGHETTTHVISGGVFELLRDTKRRDWLAADDSRLPLAVEEILRFVSAVQFTKPRIARREVEVAGVRLSKGDMVMPMIAASNGDPAVFRNPHGLVMDRAANRHVAFGAGPHFCLGHQLARFEIAAALKALLQHYPDLELAIPVNDVRWRSRLGLRAIDKLPVRVTGA